jgi:hypothetical protein
MSGEAGRPTKAPMRNVPAAEVGGVGAKVATVPVSLGDEPRAAERLETAEVSATAAAKP